MRIAILALPGVQMLDVAGPMDVFSEACSLSGDPAAYEVQIVGLTMDPIVAQNGARLLPDVSIETASEAYDTLLIAGSPSIRKYEDRAEVIAWISKMARRVRRLGSICTGAFLLAHAGLLDGRQATTHWNSTARLGELFPGIRIDPDRIYVKDGSLYTSAGVTASMDLALALVEEDHGRTAALRVAKALVLFLQRPGGQAQFSVHLAAQVSAVGPIRQIQEWILGNLDDDLTVDALARRSGMSSRNFARLFKRETGRTPADYVEAVRVEAARRILEDSDTPLKKVASMCGFGDQSGIRRAFMRRINVTPVEYRDRFRSRSPAVVAFRAAAREGSAGGRIRSDKA